MAAFSQQHTPYQLNSVFWPNPSIKTSGIIDENFLISEINPSNDHKSMLNQGYSIDGSAHESSCLEQQSINNESLHKEKQSIDKNSVSMGFNKINVSSDKKRKSKTGSSSTSTNSKDVNQAKRKKQKGDKEVKKEEQDNKDNQNKANDEEPKGYIHVRARRGQATDSHSLAERVRREKISERMKMLQALVPGCDKVTGKALMLDEIINYVQSLQNQVEFLSLKLASLDPMVHTFGLMDIDPLLFGAEAMNNMVFTMPPQMPSAAASTTGTNAITTNATATATIFPYPLVDSSTTLLQNEQKPNILSQQDGRSSSYWGVLDDQQMRQTIINQFCFSGSPNNLCSFH